MNKLYRLLLSPYFIFPMVLFFNLLRTWKSCVSPSMEYEDAKFMLAYYFNNPGFLGVIVPYNGYVSFLPNFLAWVANLLPLPAVPYALTLEAVLLSTAAFAIFSAKGIAWLIPSPWDRLMLTIIIVSIPIGRGVLVYSLGYGQWSMGVILLVLVCWYPLSASSVWLSLWSIAVIVLTISIPSSFLYIPVLMVQLFASKLFRQKALVFLTIIVGIAYQVVWVDHNQKVTIGLDGLFYSVKVFLIRVPFEVIFGAKISTLLAANGGAMFACAVSLVALGYLFIVCMESDRPKRNLFILLSGVVLAYLLVAIAVLTRFVEPGVRDIYLVQPHLQRYFLASKIIVISFMVWLLIPKLRMALSCSSCPKLRAAFSCVSLMLFVVVLNSDNNFLYMSNTYEANRMSRFIDSVQKDLEKSSNGQPYSPIHSLDRGESWSFYLDIDRHKSKSGATGLYPPKI